MIKIEFNNKKMKRFRSLVNKISVNIESILSHGYAGNRRTITVSEAKLLYEKCDDDGKVVFDASVDVEDWKNKPENEKILAPVLVLDADSRNYLAFLVADNKKEFNNLIWGPASKIDSLIDTYEKKFPILKSDKIIPNAQQRSVLYHVLFNIFVDNGYNVLKEKGRFYVATGVKVCPYCNRIPIRPFTKDKTTHVTGQLDHFYSKTIYPYLAMTRENLVPSCSICNGEGGKLDTDYYGRGLVNPYTLSDSNQFIFEVDYSVEGTIDVNHFSKILKIGFLYPGSYSDLRKNCEVFNWKQFYNQEESRKKAAATVINAILYASEPYKAQSINILQGTVTERPEEVFYRINQVFPFEKDYAKYPNSKFVVDIFRCVLKRNGVDWPF